MWIYEHICLFLLCWNPVGIYTFYTLVSEHQLWRLKISCPFLLFFMQMRPCPWSNAEDKQCVMDMQWWCIAGDWRWHKTTHADVLNSINSLVSCMYLKQQPGDDLWHLFSDQLSHLHSSCSYRLRAFSLILKQLFSTLLDLCYCFERERENQSLVLSMLKHDVSILDHFFFTLFTSVFNNYLVFIWMKELQNTFILAGGEVLRRLEGFFCRGNGALFQTGWSLQHWISSTD